MAIDFQRMFDDLNVPTRDRGLKEWVETNCPFCIPKDTHFNGGFNTINPRFYCWRCGSHSYYDALSRLLHTESIQQIKLTIASYSFISEKKDSKKIPKGVNLNLPGYELNDDEKDYLKNRGFDPDYLREKFHIRGGGYNGDWSYRILIPIYYNHILVSWTGRSILTRELQDEMKIPRYKNLSIEQSVISPKDIFFNLDNCNKSEVILVEGPMDVLKIGDDCICSLGTSVTRQQELMLSTRFKKVYIAFDNEIAAQNKAKHLGMNLSSVGLKVEVVNICEDFYKDIYDEESGEWIKVPKNDPGELTYEEVASVKKELNLL